MKNRLINLWQKIEFLKVTLAIGLICLGITAISNNQKNKYSEKKERYQTLKQVLSDLQEESKYSELKNSKKYITVKNKIKKVDNLFIAFHKSYNEADNFASRSNILNKLKGKINFIDSTVKEIEQEYL